MYIGYIDDAGDLGPISNPPLYRDRQGLAPVAAVVASER